MLAGLGGGCVSQDGALAPEAKPFNQASVGKEIPGVMGPTGEPMHVAAAGQMPTGKEGVVRADARMKPGADSGVKQTAGFARVLGRRAHAPGLGCDTCPPGGGGAGFGDPYGSMYGPTPSRAALALGHGGILPVPGMGPPGAVAAVGAIGSPGSGMYGPMYMNGRTSIQFRSPQGMNITWQGPGGEFVEPAPFQAPARYNFAQGGIYRLKISGIPTRPTQIFYPTLEVYPATPKTVTYLSHSSVPVSFTDEDFQQVQAGNLVIKVIYLPDPAYQDLVAISGADELVSTRLEPGVNPVDEANRRGTILAVIRIGNIDLQDPNSPAMDAPGMGGGMMAPPAGPAGSAPAPKTPAPSTSRPISIPTLPGSN